MEEFIRTFIAVELSQDVRAYIREYICRFQEKYDSGFRWVKVDNLHLTIKFLGDTPLSRIQQVSGILNEISVNTKPFHLLLDGTGAFPSWQRPRTIWIGLQPSMELLSFFQKMDSSLSKIAIPPEGKKYSPHLTLCRISDHAEPTNVQLLNRQIQSIPIPTKLVWMVNKVTFFKSILKPGGPVYSVLSEHLFEK